MNIHDSARLAEYVAAADRTVDWALGRQERSGAYAGGAGQISAYYKSARCFALSGHPVAGQRLIRYLRQTHATAAGDFTQAAGDRSPPGSQTYFNAWLVWGLHSLGAYDLARVAADRLERLQNPATGGMPATELASPDDQNVDWGPTALGVVALVAAGRIDAAVRAGQALQSMLASQPDPAAAMYWRTDWGGRTRTEFADADAPSHVTRFGQAGQTYWYLGAGLAALGTLHLATGEDRWLDPADRIFRLVELGRPKSLRALTSAKIGWGTSLLWSITQDSRHREVALEVADEVLAQQSSEGLWLRRPQYASLDEQPAPASLDTSIERACWLYEIARYLT